MTLGFVQSTIRSVTGRTISYSVILKTFAEAGADMPNPRGENVSRKRSASLVCVMGLVLVSLSLFVHVPDATAVRVQVWLPILPAYQDFESPDIMFGTNTNWKWPYWDWSTALLTGAFDVAADGDYTFTLNSDDGSRLSIDSTLVVNSWWDKPNYNVYGTIFLTAGKHPFWIDYYQLRGASGLDLYLPAGVTYAPDMPVPARSTSWGRIKSLYR